jgi:hypothetical protein
MAKADSDRLLEAVAAVALPSESSLNLTTDGLSLEESDHGTGYVSWSRPAPVTKRRPKPRGKRITKARTLELDELVLRLETAPKAAGATVKRRLDPGWVLALALTLIGAGVWNSWPAPEPVTALATVQRNAPRKAAASAIDGRYRLWLGNKTIAASPRSAWCILDVAHLGNGVLAAEVWRPGIEMVCQRALVSSSGTLDLVVKRTYLIPSDRPPSGVDLGEDDGSVVELWELRGRLLGSGDTVRIEGKGKRKTRQWGHARSLGVRFKAERLPVSEETILEEVDALIAEKQKPKPKAAAGGGNPHR